MQPIYIDLDEVSSDFEFTLKLDGVEHEMVEPSVDDFIFNMKEIEKLSVSASTIEEINIVIGIIARAFPTITEERLRKIKLPQLKKIQEYVFNAGAQKVEKVEGGEAAEGEKGNPPDAN